MFDLSYRKVYNKGRRGERGPKQRYAVFRAELNLKREEDYESWCENYCNLKGLNLEDYKIEHDKLPWTMTWEYIRIRNRVWPYSFPPYVMRRYNEEELGALRRNIELAERIRDERSSRIDERMDQIV